MRYTLTLVVLSVISFAFSIYGATWTYSADASLLVNGSSYSSNWSGGESGTLSWKLLSNSLAEKQITPKMNNKNTLLLLFGQTYNQDIVSRVWSSPLEADDKIDLESVLRFTLGWFLDPVIAVRMQSQFYDNRDTDNSRYVNPISLTESFGVARAIFKSEKNELIVRTGVGLKQLIDREALDPLASQRSTNISNEGGLELVADFMTRFADDRITYKSKLSVFEALFKKDGEDVNGEDYWRYPDIDWENTFSGEITKFLTVNLYFQLLYDREITEKYRYRQSISVGLTYKFLSSAPK